MTLIGLTLGLNIGVSSGGGTPAPSPPVALVAPTITGSTAQGATLTFAAPIYNVTPDQYELRITNGDGSIEYLAWTVVTNSYANSAGAAGQTLVAHWRATKNGATSAGGGLEDSAAFGPIVAGETLILAVSFNASGSAPGAYTVLVPVSNASTSAQTYTDGSQITNPNNASYGEFGFAVTSSGVFQRAGFGDARGRGIMQGGSAGQHFIVELPSAGTYRIYTGHGTTATANCGLVIREGSTAGTILHSMDAASVLSTQIADANAVITDSATWAAASTWGGTYKEIIVTTPKLFFIKSATAAMNMNNFTIVKV